MSVRRGNSDSRLTKLFRAKVDEDNLDNFLPKFLLKDLRDEKKTMEEDLYITDEKGTIFEPHETEDMSEYLKHLSFKENLNTLNINQFEEKSKISRNKFNSTGDLKQCADQHKNLSYNHLQNLILNQQKNKPGQHNGMAQNMNTGMGGYPHHRKSDSQSFPSTFVNMGTNQIFYEPVVHYSPINFVRMPNSLNDSGNFNFDEDNKNGYNIFPSIRPQPKRTNSSSQIDVKKLSNKNRNSLFMSVNDKEEKGEEFADLQELMNSINIPLWDYAKTQRGSRNLQKLLNKIEPGGLDEILEKLKFNFPELMVDTYGNYFCQKLIQSSSSEQRMFILRHIMKEFTVISCNGSGTHSLQSLIEIINMPGEEELVKEAVRNNILALSFDINGTHVIQKVISCVKEESREFINNTIMENLHKLVFDSNGICVLKKFINANQSPQMKMNFLQLITNNSLEIVQNPFGNYVIQHILDEWSPDSCTGIIDMIVSNIVSLSMQKFSSNVVEKCFDLANNATRKRLIKELFNPGKISSLLKNKYGNFVLQKAIQVMSYEEKKEIREYLAKRVSYTSNKEKARLNSLIEII